MSDVSIHYFHHWLEGENVDPIKYMHMVLVLILMPVGYLGLCYVSAPIRRGLVQRIQGESDELSSHKRDHLGEHAEDDAMGVAASMILCAIIRWQITDIFPNQEMDEEETDTATPHSMLVLTLMPVFAIVTLGGAAKIGAIAHHEAHAEKDSLVGWLMGRLLSQANFTAIFLAAWLSVFSLQYLIQWRFGWLGAHIVIRVITAGVMTFTIIPLIFVVDKFADRAIEQQDKDLAVGLTNVIDSFGIAVAYSWERAFDRCFEDISIRIGQWHSGAILDLFGIATQKLNNGFPVEYFCDEKCMKAKIMSTALISILIIVAFIPMLRRNITAAMENARMDAREARGLARKSLAIQNH